MNPKFERLTALVNDIQAACKSIKATSRADSMYKVTVVFFFTKGWRTLRGIKQLCDVNLAEDAAILTRSLFESVVHLTYISKDPSKRTILFLEYEYVQRKRRYDLLVRTTSDPWSADLSKRLLDSSKSEAIKQLMKDYNRVKGNYKGRKDMWSGLSLKDMAKAVDLEYQYNVVYWLQSNFSHPNPQAIDTYVKKDSKGFFVPPSSGEDDVHKSWRASYGYMLMLIEHMNDAFSLNFKDKIATLHNDLRAAVGLDRTV